MCQEADDHVDNDTDICIFQIHIIVRPSVVLYIDSNLGLLPVEV